MKPEDDELNTPITDPGGELERALHGEAPTSREKQTEETVLAQRLSKIARNIKPDPEFSTGLAHNLERAHPAYNRAGPAAPARNRFRRLLPALAWGGLSLVLLVGLAWSIRNLLPRTSEPAVTAPGTTQILQIQPSITPIVQETSAPTTEPASTTPTEIEASYTSSLLPGMTIVLRTDLPVEPQQALIHEQMPNQEQLTVDAARARAANLGIVGEVYYRYGEARQETLYVVSDGTQRVTFINSPNRFYLAPSTLGSAVPARPEQLPPLDEQISTAEAFLQARGLLEGPYQASTNPFYPGGVEFYPLLDGHPVVYESGGSWKIDVRLGSEGQVVGVDYVGLDFAPVETYPLRSAAEAWQIITNGNALGVLQTVYQPSLPPKAWSRGYTPGPVDMFGSLEVLLAVEPGVAPLVTVNNLRLEGELVSRIAAAVENGSFVQVWGELLPGADGGLYLQVAGWQPSPIQNEYLPGRLERRPEGAILVGEDGQELLLPEAPEDIANGTAVFVLGVVLQGPPMRMEWTYISEQGQGFGGGGGGGSTFFQLNLTGAAVPTATPLPYTPGDRLEGVNASIGVTRMLRPDGNDLLSFGAAIEPSAQFPDGLYARLEGPGLAGLEAYNGLPVRLWGTLLEVGAFDAVMEVERFEPQYPGLTYQAWLGVYEKVYLEGQNVVRFTSADGQAYILASSLDYDPDDMLASDSGPLLIEGLVYPENVFAGMPVITEVNFISEDVPSTLEGYIPQAGKPLEIGEAEAQRGKAIVEQVELVYVTANLTFLSADAEPGPFYVQPAWRFRGQYEDGTIFELLVQALPDAYLAK